MNKINKILSTLAVVFISVFTLASCGSKEYTNSDFYTEFYEAGATNLTEDHMFEMITADDVVAKREKNENFIVYLGTPSLANDVDTVNALAYDAKNTNYKGKIYFINLDLYEGNTKKAELNEKLGIKYDGNTTLLCVCYTAGETKSKVEFSTTKLNSKYEEMFTINGTKQDVHAIAAFTFLFNNYYSK